MVVRSVELRPDPPADPRHTQIVINADLQRPLEDGAYLDVTVRLGRVKLVAHSFDLLKELQANGTVSPWQHHIPPGPLTLAFPPLRSLLNDTRPGRYVVLVNAHAAEDELLASVYITVDFEAP